MRPIRSRPGPASGLVRATHRAALALALLGAPCLVVLGAAPPPARLLVEVRTTPPDDAPAFHRGADRSYTVGTGGGGDLDEQPARDGDQRATLLRGGNARRLLHVRAGEALRVELPSRQSLQFHVAPPAPGAADAPARPGAAGRAGAAGVVYFDAVAAFAARFYLVGDAVNIELVALQAGGVAAPWIDIGPERAARPPGSALQLRGRAGEWIALGDASVAAPARGLMPTAEPPSAAALWVRVVADDAPRREDNSAEVGTRR